MISGTRHIRQLPARAERAWALDPDDLEAAIQADIDAGLIPFYLVATFGTTSSCAVDPLRPLGKLAARHGLWCAPCCAKQSCVWVQHLPTGLVFSSWLAIVEEDSLSTRQVVHALLWLAKAGPASCSVV